LAANFARIASMPPHHHTTDGFRNNYIDSVTKSLGDLLRWQWQRIRDHLPPEPSLPTPRVEADLGFIRRNALAGAHMDPAATWIGHATMLVQASGLNVLTDPIFSLRASPLQCAGPKRVQAPGIALEDLPHIAPLYLVPLGLKPWMERLGIAEAVELDWWDGHVHGGVEFQFTPAQHWSGRCLRDRNRTLWGGFDLALIAVGACLPRWFMKDQHVDLHEALQIHLDLGAKRSVGVHWGAFALPIGGTRRLAKRPENAT
jgi:N-acyl-phosphatidylethanolamine-hydrolysing phospholipase D